MKQKVVEFKVEVNDVITPLSCSAMIIEFVKYIVYQKQMIPYPYERLKMYVSMRKKQLIAQKENANSCSSVTNPKESLISQKYFKKTEAAYDSLENIFKTITDELSSCNYGLVEEVVLLLGTSFTNPQDVYRLCIPKLNYAHLVKYHSTKKNWRNLFRTMINSEKFNDIVCGNGCTGVMHILLKMKPKRVTADTNLYIPRTGFKLPAKGNHAIITFETENVHADCSCGDFKIFQDESSSSSNIANECKYLDEESLCSSSMSKFDDLSSWYQIKDTLKYFEDVAINNVSLTDVWMNPKQSTK